VGEFESWVRVQTGGGGGGERVKGERMCGGRVNGKKLSPYYEVCMDGHVYDGS
jgi:hypothetical protein